jgi:hypothetical protein
VADAGVGPELREQLGLLRRQPLDRLDGDVAVLGVDPAPRERGGDQDSEDQCQGSGSGYVFSSLSGNASALQDHAGGFIAWPAPEHWVS